MKMKAEVEVEADVEDNLLCFLRLANKDTHNPCKVVGDI
jgi:hypothetical protein